MVGRSYEELCDNEGFMAKAAECANAEELQALAATYGLHGTKGEASRAFEKLHAARQKSALQDDQLDAVAGGGDATFAANMQAGELDSVSGKKGPSSNKC